MIQSMTGFGSKEKDIAPFGKISVELRSANHKFLETVMHVPEGFLSLEERIKKEVESRIKRGRVTCVINISGSKSSNVFINKALIMKYIESFKGLKKQFHLKDEISINTLIHLPGALSLETNHIPKERIWPHLKMLLEGALKNLATMRAKEGRALQAFLRSRAESLDKDLDTVKARFKEALKEKLRQFPTDEERSSFLRETDVAEEIERLTFHIRNFKSKLKNKGPVGKELDFIAQEMQREANTLAAKTFDVGVSAKVVEMKSQVEKIREQVQNIE